MTFAFFMTGPQELRILQSYVTSWDINSNYTWNGNESVRWEQASVQFGSPHLGGIIIIESPSISQELGEAPIVEEPYLAIDDIKLTFTFPCDFSSLGSPGNLILSHPAFLRITLGQVNTIQFSASSLVCPEGPFVYMLESSTLYIFVIIFISCLSR